MRIISGKYKGRTIHAPHGHITHPMSEKIRGAIFNLLGDISGLTVLDAFSGSGAVALEALSRDVKSVVAIDNSKKAILTIKQNVKELNALNIKVVQANISSWSENNPTEKFNIVVCDPPYDAIKHDQIKSLEKNLLSGGLFILSLPPEALYRSKFEKIAEKNYGDAKLIIYRG